MNEVETAAAINALIPSLSVTTVITLALLAVLNGKVIRKGEHEAIIKRYETEQERLDERYKAELGEVRQQRDKYEAALWELTDVAKTQARATEKLGGMRP